MTGSRSIEERLRIVEDRLEIYNLIASHPPSADTGGSDHISASWADDGVFDRGEDATRGRSAIAEQVLSPAHQAAIAGGIAHFTGLPHVAISGDTAIVTSYLQVIVPQTQGDPVAVPNHGSEPSVIRSAPPSKILGEQRLWRTAQTAPAPRDAMMVRPRTQLKSAFMAPHRLPPDV